MNAAIPMHAPADDLAYDVLDDDDIVEIDEPEPPTLRFDGVRVAQYVFDDDEPTRVLAPHTLHSLREAASDAIVPDGALRASSYVVIAGFWLANVAAWVATYALWR